MNYQFLLLLMGVTLCLASASVIPQPTYVAGVPPAIVTAHSHQVVARNYNRVYVPTVGGYVPRYVPGYVPGVVPYATTYSTAAGVIPYYPSVYTNTRYGYTYPVYPGFSTYGSPYW